MGQIGAGEGNRTLVFSLEGCCSTIELHPLLNIWSLHSENSFCIRIINNQSERPYQWWKGKDSNLRRQKSADLQSAAINHSATFPKVFTDTLSLYDKILSVVCRFFCHLSSTFFVLWIKYLVFLLFHRVVMKKYLR